MELEIKFYDSFRALIYKTINLSFSVSMFKCNFLRTDIKQY